MRVTNFNVFAISEKITNKNIELGLNIMRTYLKFVPEGAHGRFILLCLWILGCVEQLLFFDVVFGSPKIVENRLLGRPGIAMRTSTGAPGVTAAAGGSQHGLARYLRRIKGLFEDSKTTCLNTPGGPANLLTDLLPYITTQLTAREQTWISQGAARSSQGATRSSQGAPKHQGASRSSQDYLGSSQGTARAS